MLKISAVLIVKNESEMLARCLDSVKGVDEIIVCDTGSEDNTIEIAKKYTDKVFTDFVWCDDFAKARNHALSKATGDWILSIDADEYLHDLAEVRRVAEQAESHNELAVDCYLIHEGTKVTHCFPRLFKRCPEVWWEGAVHNHVCFFPPHKKQVTAGDVKITYGYSPAHEKDPERSLRILTKEVERTGNARETYYLGREYWYRRNYLKCIEIMEQYLPKSHFLMEKADAYLLVARCYWAMAMGDQARLNCMQAIMINPHFKEAVLFMSLLAGKGTGDPTWEANGEWWEKASENSQNTNVLFKS